MCVTVECKKRLACGRKKRSVDVDERSVPAGWDEVEMDEDARVLDSRTPG